VILSTNTELRVPLRDLSIRAIPGPDGGWEAQEAEHAHILTILKETNWVLSGPRGAATRLGINRSTLQFRMKGSEFSAPGPAHASSELAGRGRRIIKTAIRTSVGCVRKIGTR